MIDASPPVSTGGMGAASRHAPLGQGFQKLELSLIRRTQETWSKPALNGSSDARAWLHQGRDAHLCLPLLGTAHRSHPEGRFQGSVEIRFNQHSTRLRLADALA